MKITFVAAPLTARSGVYRSAREIVRSGRALGEEWNLLLGVSDSASGTAPDDDPAWVDEFTFNPAGIKGVYALHKFLSKHPKVRESEIVISLIPQTDMALAMSEIPWISYARGLPWPAPGESSSVKRAIWRQLERLALRKASAVWATTSVLQRELEWPRGTEIVPAGIQPVERLYDGSDLPSAAVWAARFDRDKNPQLFLRALEGQEFQGRMYGTGRLEDAIKRVSPPNVVVAGWTAPDVLWNDAFAYVGTSFREAFGRSALEAAMSGIPVVVSEVFGVADQIVTAPDLRRRFVLPLDDLRRWRGALESLRSDRGLRTAYSDHLVENSAKLTIDVSAAAIRHAASATRMK